MQTECLKVAQTLAGVLVTYIKYNMKVLIAVDESETAEKAFQCKLNTNTVIHLQVKVRVNFLW